MKAKRRQEILKYITKQGQITIAETCDLFHISEMTARRDLRDLDQIGALRRVHGGAIKIPGRSYEPPYHLRASQVSDAKRAIGKAAADLIFDGDSIALDIGTTTLEVAKALKGKHNLTILTACLPIANEIANSFSIGSDVRLILTGGILRAGELSMIGHIAENTFNNFNVDKAVLAIAGISIDGGLSTYNLEDALVKRAIIHNARHTILVAEGPKFNRTTFASISPISEIDIFITDRSAPSNIIEYIKNMGKRVIIADQESSSLE